MSKSLIAANCNETAALAAVHLLQFHNHLPPVWLAAPFILLLLMIATPVLSSILTSGSIITAKYPSGLAESLLHITGL